MKTVTKNVALGGVLAALAIVIMLLGGFIPVATYICPMLCMILCFAVSHICGKRIAWAWYGAVAILSCIFAPDKEAAAVFVFLGYYPIMKEFFDKIHWGFILKLLYFNISVCALYGLLIHFLGMDQLMAEFTEFGLIGLAVLIVLGNIVFALTDLVLNRICKGFR